MISSTVFLHSVIGHDFYNSKVNGSSDEGPHNPRVAFLLVQSLATDTREPFRATLECPLTMDQRVVD